MGRRISARPAYSLMEVIVATAILLGSTIVLTQLAGIAREHAWRADDVTTAQVLGQNKMNELLAGIVPLEIQDEEPLEDNPQWTYSIQFEPLDVGRLVSVTVTISEDVDNLELARRTDRRPRSFRLVRWMRQPEVTAVGEMPSLPATVQDPGRMP